MSSPTRFFFSGDETRRRHFLDACFLCKKPIAKNEDVFMYRGDTPFCSKECRWEQIDMDEALENDRVVYSGSASKQSSTGPIKRKPSLIVPNSKCDEKNHFRVDTAIVAG